MYGRFVYRYVSIISVALMSTVVTNVAQSSYPEAYAPTQGYCTAEEAQAINQRGLANLYNSNPSMACADFLAAIDAGQCPAAAAQPGGAAVSSDYITNMFADYGIYNPYPWEINYILGEPDYYDQAIALAILVLERFSIFNVFPEEIFLFINDRRHFRDHLEEIRERIRRSGNRPDKFGNRPIHLSTVRPHAGRAIDPAAMRNNINKVRAAHPSLGKGQGAQPGASTMPGRGVQPNVPGRGAIAQPGLMQRAPGIVRPNIPRGQPVMPHPVMPHPVMPHVVPHAFAPPVVPHAFAPPMAPHIPAPQMAIPHGGGGFGGGGFGGGHFGGGGFGGGHFGGGGGGGHFGGGGHGGGGGGHR